ncbi:MAG: O-antigen ligase family protein [Xanthobacteraceae bacterium]
MVVRHPTIFYEPQSSAAAAALKSNSRPLLVVSLFFILAGNISLATTVGDQSSVFTAVIRAAGLACGIGGLMVALSKQADNRIQPLVLWLSPFAVFLMYCTFSAAWSLQPSATLIRSAETMTTVGFSALWTHVAARQCRSERDLCTWIASAVIAVALYGLFVNAALFGDPIRIVVSNEETVRARFVFGSLHPLAVGDILAIGAIATMMSSFRISRKVLALLLLLLLLYLTNATGAAIMATAIGAGYGGVIIVKNLGAARSIVLLPFSMVTAGFAVGIAFALELPLTRRLVEDQRLWTFTGRTQLWSAIWESGLASTWFGTGFDAARSAILEIFGVAYQVHNQYLAVLVELGYVGLAQFIPVLVIWLVPIVKSQSLVIGCFTLYILGINMDNASMFTKTWLIFLTVFCYVLALEMRRRSWRSGGRTHKTSSRELLT